MSVNKSSKNSGGNKPSAFPKKNIKHDPQAESARTKFGKSKEE